jgi:hypothetical protein
MRILKLFILFSIVLLGCKTEETISPSSTSSNPLSSGPSTIPGVYVGGYEGKGGQGVGKIWKNEEVLYSNSSSSSLITDIFINGNDVYSVGNEFDGKTTNATIWKNGIATILGNKVKSSSANAIFVSGNDVYVCGNQEDTKGAYTAVLWKNGISSVIDARGELSTIFVSGSDVYVSGSTGNSSNWGLSVFKNGKLLYFDKDGGYPTGMFVSGNDVYVSGYGNNNGSQAKLWKNGVVTILDQVKTGSISAKDVFVSGKDVYVVGEKQLTTFNFDYKFYPSVAILWKNGIPTNLSNGNTIAFATSVFVSGSDVYVCGYEYAPTFISSIGSPSGKIWKNGVPSVVSKTNNNLTANSIFVVK